VRQTFLLDENIIYHAINGVDEHDLPDLTAAELLVAISRICHRIFVHQDLIDRYNKALRRLREEPPRSPAALRFVSQLLYRSEKQSWAQGPLPELPEGLVVPGEDRDVVRAALLSRPILVTNDRRLGEAVNGYQQVLGLKALSARGALEFAKSERPDA
jgi:hypothetical protein